MSSFRRRLYLKRFQYWPPWACTYWYRPYFAKVSDELYDKNPKACACEEKP